MYLLIKLPTHIESVRLSDRSQWSIGRHPDSDIVIDEREISRKHAVLQREGLSFILEDQGSRNGTYVNGERITKARYLEGPETICFGPIECKLSRFPVQLIATNTKGE